MEGGDGAGGKPRRNRGPPASGDRNLFGNSARHWSADSPGRICGFSVSRQPLDFGVWYLVDLGTAGFGAGVPRARYRTRWPELGHGRVAVRTVAIFALVVIGTNLGASFRNHPHP